ncbi:MAG: hypothetical protein AAF798_18970 [Bacteroidota bacterium]
MFNIRYIPLIRVVVDHQYYSAGQSPDLVFVPTADCQQLLTNLKLRFLPEPTGFSIAMRITEAMDATTFRPYVQPSQPLRLRFYVGINNPNFFTFSQLQGPPKGDQIYYLSNRFDKSIAGAPPQLLLSGHENGDNHVSVNDQVRIVAATFKYQLSTPGAQVSIRERFENQATILWPRPDSPQGEGNTIECNLEGLPNGRYQLREDNGTTVELYKDSAFSPTGGMGLLELLGESPTTNFGFLTPQGDGSFLANQRTYHIRFLARAAFWRYFIIAQSEAVSLNNFSIANSFSSVPVPASMEAKYGTGNIALWQSQAAIALSDNPSTTVDYQYDPPGPTNASGQLPSPSLANTGPRRDNSGNLLVDGAGAPIFYSEEYVIL